MLNDMNVSSSLQEIRIIEEQVALSRLQSPLPKISYSRWNFFLLEVGVVEYKAVSGEGGDEPEAIPATPVPARRVTGQGAARGQARRGRQHRRGTAAAEAEEVFLDEDGDALAPLARLGAKSYPSMGGEDDPAVAAQARALEASGIPQGRVLGQAATAAEARPADELTAGND